MEPLNELAKALVAFQTACKGASLDGDNPAFKRDGKPLKYMTLTSVWGAIRPLLAEHGLSVIQMPEPATDGLGLATMVLHTSGQSLTSHLVMPLPQKTPQAVGSAITYARRYAICSMLGIVAEEDDDANGAMPPQKPTKDNRNAPPARPPADPTPKTPLKQASPIVPMLVGLRSKFAERFGIEDNDPTVGTQFVQFARDTIGTTDDLSLPRFWTVERITAVSGELDHVGVLK